MIVTYADDREVLPAPRSHPGARDLGAGVRRRRRSRARSPTRASRGSRRSCTTRASRAGACKALHDAFIARGEESPYAQWFERGFPDNDDRFTTFVDVGDWLHRRRAALLAHRTQVDPEGHWMRLPDDVDPRGVPVGRVRPRPRRSSATVPPPATPRTTCSPASVPTTRVDTVTPIGRLDETEDDVAKYLTQEWLDEARELAKDQPERPGASARMQYVVTGGPDGDIKYYWVLENGKLLEASARRDRRRRRHA